MLLLRAITIYYVFNSTVYNLSVCLCALMANKRVHKAFVRYLYLYANIFLLCQFEIYGIALLYYYYIDVRTNVFVLYMI